MLSKKQKYVIGVDGGGTKTMAVLADLKGKVLARAKTGPANPNKIGITIAMSNLAEAIGEVSRKYQKSKIAFIYVALAGGLERDKKRKAEIKRILLKQAKLSWVSSEKLAVEKDQLAAFRSGAGQKDGVLLIAGTGSIAFGWRKRKEVISGGWGHILGDDGSGFYLGQKACRLICRQLDKRGPETQLTDLIFREWGIKRPEELYQKVYTDNLVSKISSLVVLIDKAAQNGDKIARDILVEGGKELSLAANTVIKKLDFQKVAFPIVLIGGVFKSKIVLDIVKKEIRKSAPKVQFIRPKVEPVIGAVKLAIKQISK